MFPRQTKHIKSKVNFLIKSLKGLSRADVRKFLKEHGYKEIDCGAYKTVYRKNNESFCVKIFSVHSRDDSINVPEEIKHVYIHPHYQDKIFMIQDWGGETLSNFLYRKYGDSDNVIIPRGIKLTFPRRFIRDGCYDLHTDNLVIYKNKIAIIDFFGEK